MGSCWSGFLAELQNIRRPLDYIGRSHQARSARYNVRDRGDGIEFDSLLSEDEYEIQTKPRQKVITDEEATFINQKRYGDLAQKQKTVNEQIDRKLQKHEEDLRQQEEEFYAAKREAARVARQEKAKNEKGDRDNKTEENSKRILDDSAFASWLSDEDDEIDDHDLDTQEFEEFLQKVRQTTYPGGPADTEGGESSKPSSNAVFEESLQDDVQATKLAERSLDALDRWSPTFDDD
ncbi:AP-1 complex-associated regulatory protein-like [Dendronephthya gigantea]|uniref:AP-1 complex-associated regulatory protein-like n=1 Tax=Dendronephthya gigantea TaxID=151771 RepID=UPI00106A5667|nr:AP-1 complex-associated regulatory protein-like [Dendronephthya gigantea]